MSKTIPNSVVLKSYFWAYSAVDIACGLSFYYRSHISAQQVKDAWAVEARSNPLLNQARPENGFPSSDKTKIAELLVA